MPMSWGVLTPTARAEYRQTLDGAFQQSMYYSDIGASMTSTLAQTSTTRGTSTPASVCGRAARAAWAG